MILTLKRCLLVVNGQTPYPPTLYPVPMLSPCIARLTDDNRGMINDTRSRTCKRNAILVNTARGGLINDEALLHALKDGTLAQRGTRQLYQRAADRPEPVADRR